MTHIFVVCLRVFQPIEKTGKSEAPENKGGGGGLVGGWLSGDVLRHLSFKKNASFDVEDEPTQLKPSLGRDGSEGWLVVWGLLPGCECVFAMKEKQWETIVRNTM